MMFSNLRTTPKERNLLEVPPLSLSTDPPLHMGPARAPTPTGPSQQVDEDAVMQSGYRCATFLSVPVHAPSSA